MEPKWAAGIFLGEKAREERATRRAKVIAGVEAHFKVNLELAEIALNEIDYLAPGDRGEIETAVSWIMIWLPIFLKSKNADEVREAGYWLAAYDHVIGARCVVCDTEEEYWRRRKCFKGGKKPDPDTKKWRDWADPLIAANLGVHAPKMARSLIAEKSRPRNLPEESHLTKYVRDTQTRLKATGSGPRLVHSK